MGAVLVVKIPPSLKKRIEEAVTLGLYTSQAELVRSAVRAELRRLGLVAGSGRARGSEL